MTIFRLSSDKESSPIWERGADLACHMFYLFVDVIAVIFTSLPFYVEGRVWDLILSVPDRCSFFRFVIRKMGMQNIVFNY